MMTARCPGGAGRFHLPPNPRCRCGIYGWKRPVDPALVGELVGGVVLLWGRMCDGERMTGYRAQYARIVALAFDARVDRDRYPVRWYPDLPTMYGDWDVSPELGWAKDAT